MEHEKSDKDVKKYMHSSNFFKNSARRYAPLFSLVCEDEMQRIEIDNGDNA